jgi:WD40 repeat protein/serine/threonine protein kinase
VDQVCDRFEDTWLAGEQPRIEEFLPEVAEDGPAFFRELLRLELELRRREGEKPAQEDYDRRFPPYRELIQTEFLSGRRNLAAKSDSQATPTRDPVPTHLFPAQGPETVKNPQSSAVPLPSIPGYEVVGVLGEGGMGIVYQARQVALNRQVAIKMLRPGAYAGDKERVRFQAEAEAVARLRHPNIVQVYEVGEHEGRPFFSLEYVSGGSLAARLKGTPLPARQAAELVETVARAVAYAHQQGVIHRDLKPGNILLQGSGIRDQGSGIRDQGSGIRDQGSGIRDQGSESRALVPKITDFGLAKRLDEDSSQTGSGTIVGTPSYMAPEQAVPHSTADGPGGIGPAADVYALGAVLYEALTGRAPFKGATVLDTLEMVRGQDPVPPRRLQPKLPRDLETIALKCLAKDPRRRYATAAGLADDLRAFLDGHPIKARPVGKLEQAAKWARRRPAVALLTATLALTAVVGIGLVTWQWRAAVTARHETEQQRQRAEHLLIGMSLENAQALCEKGEVGRGLLLFARTLAMVPAEREDLRRAIRANLGAWRRRLHALRELLPHPAAIENAGFSPDGRLVWTSSADHCVRLWDAETGEPVGRLLEHPRDVLAVALSPDGRLVLTGCADENARLWEADTGRLVGMPLKHRGRVAAVRFGRGGKTFLTGSERLVKLWETRTVQPIAEGEHQGRVLSIAVSPDGKTVLTGSADRTARLWDARDLRAQATSLPEQAGEVRTVGFSPGGKILLTVSRDSRKRGDDAVHLWHANTGRPLATLAHHYWVRAVAFSPNGGLVVTGSEDHTAQLWDTATGERVGIAMQHQDTVRAVAFGPDGKTVITASDDRTARLWDLGGNPLGQPLDHQGPVVAAAFQPNGLTVLTGSTDRTVRLWQPAAAHLYLREYRHAGAQVMAVAWSVRGDAFVTGTDRDRAWRWRLDSDEHLETPLKHEDDVWVAACSPDGRTILTGSRDSTIRLWDGATGQLLRILWFIYRVRSAAFSPDGKRFLAEEGGTDPNRGRVRLWDVETGSPLGPFVDVPGLVWQVAFSPNGRSCAVASGDNAVCLWDLPTGRARFLAAVHLSRVVALAFSPDGQRLVTGSTDKTAQLWDAATGKPVGEPLKHQGGVWGVGFSADGRTVVTGGRGGGARLWDAATGTPIGPVWPHQQVVWAVACHPTEPLVLTGSADRTARLWQIPDPVDGQPEQITLWLQVITGMDLDDNGKTHWLDAATWFERRRRLGELGGPPGP